MATWSWWRDEGDDGHFEKYEPAANEQLEEAYKAHGEKAKVTLKTQRGNYVVKYNKATSRRAASWVQHRQGNAGLWRLVERREPDQVSLVSDEDEEVSAALVGMRGQQAAATLTEAERLALEQAEARQDSSPVVDDAACAPASKEDEATTEEDDWDEETGERGLMAPHTAQVSDGVDGASDESIPLDMGGNAAGEEPDDETGGETGGEDDAALVHSSDMSAGNASSAPLEMGGDALASTQEWRDVEETAAGEAEVEVEVAAESGDGDATEEDEAVEEAEVEELDDEESRFLALAPPAMIQGERRQDSINQVRFILQQTPEECAVALARLEVSGVDASGDEYAFFSRILRERAQLANQVADAPGPPAKRMRR